VYFVAVKVTIVFHSSNWQFDGIITIILVNFTRSFFVCMVLFIEINEKRTAIMLQLPNFYQIFLI